MLPIILSALALRCLLNGTTRRGDKRILLLASRSVPASGILMRSD